ncbi:MAG: LamG domain-containing protein [Spirochaetaceae bacterium]|nr:MAG: LamG domain-containing protein [Spirochaetaceae bacterium]
MSRIMRGVGSRIGRILLFALVLAVPGVVCPMPVRADRLELVNGDVITGTIVRMTEAVIVIDTEYGRLEIDRSRVARGVIGPVDTSGASTSRPVAGDSMPDPAAAARAGVAAAAEGDAAGAIAAVSALDRAHESAASIVAPAAGLLIDAPLSGDLRDRAGGAARDRAGGSTGDRAGAFTIVNNGMEFVRDPVTGRAALASDGSGTFLSIAPSDRLNALQALTVSFSVLPDSTSDTTYLVSKWTRATADRADGKFALQLSRGGLSLFVVDRDGRYSWVGAPNVVRTGVWQHVAFSFGDGVASLYVDGRMVARRSTGFSGLLVEEAPLLFMTAQAMMDEPYVHYNARGQLRDVRLYDRALSADEIAIVARLVTDSMDAGNAP